MKALMLTMAALAVIPMAVLAQPRRGGVAKPSEGPGSRHESDERAIRQAAEDFTQAFNRGDAAALAAMWTPEGEYVDEMGAVTSGRAQIEKAYTAFFKERPGARIQVTIHSIRFVAPTVAVEEGTSRLDEPEVGPTSAADYTALHVKQDGRWLMASVEDRASAPLGNYEILRELEPLIGTWTIRSENGRVETSFEWMYHRHLIRREFTTYQGNEVVGSGFEIIGIDPSVGQISSWHFGDDGAVGRGWWVRDGESWVIDATGTMPDGRSTSATNLLTPVDRDTYTWRSYDRTLDGEPLPDAPIVRIERTAKPHKEATP